MECPICLENYDEMERYECDVCKKAFCIQCLQNLKKDECPFCRLNFSTSLPASTTMVVSNSVTQDHQPSQSLPSYMYASTIVPQWERSRILTRQLRRERKRQEHEQQRLRNAEASRIHNMERLASRRPTSRQERRNELMFDIDMDTT
jgi:hypothetical protein